MKPPRFALCVPTYNAGEPWHAWLAALHNQTHPPAYTLVIDSSSSDNTANLARAAGLDVQTIRKENFNHGGTRQDAVEQLADYDTLVFLTQDAILHTPDALARLVNALHAQLEVI